VQSPREHALLCFIFPLEIWEILHANILFHGAASQIERLNLAWHKGLFNKVGCTVFCLQKIDASSDMSEIVNFCFSKAEGISASPLSNQEKHSLSIFSEGSLLASSVWTTMYHNSLQLQTGLIFLGKSDLQNYPSSTKCSQMPQKPQNGY